MTIYKSKLQTKMFDVWWINKVTMSNKIKFIASFEITIKSPSTYITENEPFLFQQNKLQSR
jgi:hypothetical protein